MSLRSPGAVEHHRKGGPFRSEVGPVAGFRRLRNGSRGVLRPTSALVDPGSQPADLCRRQLRLVLGGHLPLGIVARRQAEQAALQGVARLDHWPGIAALHRLFTVVQAQAAALFLGAMTGDALLGEDRLDVAPKSIVPAAAGGSLTPSLGLSSAAQSTAPHNNPTQPPTTERRFMAGLI